MTLPSSRRSLWRFACFMASCQAPYLCEQVEAFCSGPTMAITCPRRPYEYPLHMVSSPDEDLNLFNAYDEFIDELDAALTDDYTTSNAAAGGDYPNTGAVPVPAKEQKKMPGKPRKKTRSGRQTNRSPRRTKSRGNYRKKGDDGSVVTYQDTQYEMFLSNLEKDMIEGWRKQLEHARATGKDGPLSSPDYFEPLNDRDSVTTTASTAGTDNYTTTEDFLQTLSIEQVKERLREAGLHVGGKSKNVLIQRLLGKESTETERFLAKLTVPQLKERLREAGLPVAGRKAELIDRLLGNTE
mmetsp:Transcript_12990/g.27517  ORF Transcript_12990/g.27517 Transcript_12990/m.27517 type:complete len:297 (+) Transcript_12990:76-966(+)